MLRPYFLLTPQFLFYFHVRLSFCCFFFLSHLDVFVLLHLLSSCWQFGDITHLSETSRSGLERQFQDGHVVGSTPIQALLLRARIRCFTISICAWWNLTSSNLKKTKAKLSRKTLWNKGSSYKRVRIRPMHMASVALSWQEDKNKEIIATTTSSPLMQKQIDPGYFKGEGELRSKKSLNNFVRFDFRSIDL